MTNSSTAMGNQGTDDQRPIPITIDGQSYMAPRARMTGAEIRNLPQPPIGENYELFLTVPGADDDVLVEAGMTLDLKPGMEFYSAPRTINPGGQYAAF